MRGVRILKHGAELLDDWIERRRLDQSEAARIIGLDPTNLNAILKRRRAVGLAAAIAIEDATGIPAEAWLLATRKRSAHGGTDGHQTADPR